MALLTFQISLKCCNPDLYLYFSQPVSEVKYRVGHKTSDVEDLNPPSRAHLKQSLAATAGKTLHSRSKKDTDDEEEVEYIIRFFM